MPSSSSNPFRKKGPSAIESQIPAVENIDPSLSYERSPTTFRYEDPAERPMVAHKDKVKVVKRVRVQSPPPPSPDSPEWLDDTTAALSTQDPFENEAFESDRDDDLRWGSSDGKSLDVDAFQRLLMTGSAEAHSSGQGIKAKIASSGAQETQPMSAEEEKDLLSQFGVGKKQPPPPPSSRHGKSIKNDLKRDSRPGPLPLSLVRGDTTSVDGTTELHQNRDRDLPSGDKKPLPTPPPRKGHIRMDSRADTTSATKDDDLRPVVVRSNSSAPVPPPPRRPHSGPRPVSVQPSPTPGSFIGASISHHRHYTQQLDSGLSTPIHQTETPFETIDAISGSNGKLPPRPPARNPSTRRTTVSVESQPVTTIPSSGNSNGNGSGSGSGSRPRLPGMSSAESSRRASGEIRRVSGGEGKIPPPPPPSRKRGNSKSNNNNPGFSNLPTKNTTTTTSLVDKKTLETPHEGQQTQTDEQGRGGSILADLDALQREVDALRGKLE